LLWCQGSEVCWSRHPSVWRACWRHRPFSLLHLPLPLRLLLPPPPLRPLVEEWRHVELDSAADSQEAGGNCMIAGSKTLPLPVVRGGLHVLVEDRAVQESLQGLNVLQRWVENLVQEGPNVLQRWVEDPVQEGPNVLQRLEEDPVQEGSNVLRRLMEDPNVLPRSLEDREDREDLEDLIVWRVPAVVASLIEHSHRGVHMRRRADKGLVEENNCPQGPESCVADMIRTAMTAEDSVVPLAGGTPDTGREQVNTATTMPRKERRARAGDL